jgi:hypothetical protein
LVPSELASRSAHSTRRSNARGKLGKPSVGAAAWWRRRTPGDRPARPLGGFPGLSPWIGSGHCHKGPSEQRASDQADHVRHHPQETAHCPRSIPPALSVGPAQLVNRGPAVAAAVGQSAHLKRVGGVRSAGGRESGCPRIQPLRMAEDAMASPRLCDCMVRACPGWVGRR